jgi:hypothetical protein
MSAWRPIKANYESEYIRPSWFAHLASKFSVLRRPDCVIGHHKGAPWKVRLMFAVRLGNVSGSPGDVSCSFHCHTLSQEKMCVTHEAKPLDQSQWFRYAFRKGRHIGSVIPSRHFRARAQARVSHCRTHSTNDNQLWLSRPRSFTTRCRKSSCQTVPA